MQKVLAVILSSVMALGLASCKPARVPSPTAVAAPAPDPAPARVSEWVVFEATPEATIYIDPSTIRREGDRAEMWALIDYKTPQPDKTGKQVLSDKLQYQYDCKARQLSIIATSAHAGPMASGEIINVNPDPPQVTPIPAGTTAEQMWARACGDATV
jgi:hypothetical protein